MWFKGRCWELFWERCKGNLNWLIFPFKPLCLWIKWVELFHLKLLKSRPKAFTKTGRFIIEKDPMLWYWMLVILCDLIVTLGTNWRLKTYGYLETWISLKYVQVMKQKHQELQVTTLKQRIEEQGHPMLIMWMTNFLDD